MTQAKTIYILVSKIGGHKTAEKVFSPPLTNILKSIKYYEHSQSVSQAGVVSF